jgi:hypothetical protein
MFQADQEAWLELCDAYLNEMEFAKAAFCLEELILMNPHNHVYHQRYADVGCPSIFMPPFIVLEKCY